MSFGDYAPIPVSEWNDPDGHIDQCAWCSAVMLANKASLGAYPGTLAFSKTIGEHAATISDVSAGLQQTVGWSGRQYAGTFAGFLAILTPGTGAVAQGYYSGLPPYWHRFDDAFAAKGLQSVHDVYVQRQPDGSIWWIDPLFHGESGYRGEPVSQAVLGAFMTAYHSGAKALLVLESSHLTQSGPQEDPVSLPVSDPTPAIVSYAIGDPLFDLAGTKLTTFSVAGSQESPYEVALANGRKYRVVLVTTGGTKQLCLVGTASARPVPPPPDTTPFAQADVDAAYARGKVDGAAVGREKQHEVDVAAVTAAPTV